MSGPGVGIPHTLWAGSLEALGTLGAGFSELGGGGGRVLVIGCELMGNQTEVVLGARLSGHAQSWMRVVTTMCQEFERPPRGKDLKDNG